ncbi:MULTISPECIES: hypothetical protein [unclassified Veillonella]|uniref:hypothetical protein n=1 Tax=unclassified Veillonella TaxID=2630086 RepID=UPI000F8D4E61|nr:MULTISPECIES: hypothetical protein [unclassified Veillonella]
MKLVERITLVIKEIGKDIKALKGRVLALEGSAGSGTVDETVVTNKVTEQINVLKSELPTLVTPTINAEIAKVVDGAPATFDTLKEIADYIDQDKTGASAMAESINKRLRVDEQQSLTEQEQSNVLGALGLTDSDFVSVYNTAVNG